MRQSTIDHLTINSPFNEPTSYWSYDRESRTFDQKDGRRPAGYVIASQSSKAFDDPGIFVPIPLVNQMRPRVKAWREAGYPGVTGITKRLLEHWNNPDERQYQFFSASWKPSRRSSGSPRRQRRKKSASTFHPTAVLSHDSVRRWPPAPAKPPSWRC